MNTYRFTTTNTDIVKAAILLKQGETIAFPTETVYGLGANALDEQAVDKIFTAKGRPSDNPLIVHIAHREHIHKIARHVPPSAELCMDRFWPGPLTLVLPCTDLIPSKVTAGLDTVGIRMPDHPTAQHLIDAAGVPLAAPSANRSGRPSPTTADHVLEDLDGRIAGVVDGGPSGVGVESTVLDLTGEVPMILRPGGITKEMLAEVLGEVHIDPSLESGVGRPKAPGMKYTHYAPKGTMSLVEAKDESDRRQRIQALVNQTKQKSPFTKVGVLTTEESAAFYDADFVIGCGNRHDLYTVAAGLYDAIREFDHLGAEQIFAEMFPDTGVGLAIMNRLRKAAGHRIIHAEN